jgi:hypothetical protein
MLTASRSAVQTDIVRRTRSTQAARVRTTKRPLWVISGHFAMRKRCPLYPRKRTCAVQIRMSALGQKRTLTICLVAPLLRASATVPGLPLLRGSSDVVRARIAEATIAPQNIASAVAVFERAILAVPIAVRDHRTPRSLVGLRRVSPKDRSSKSNDGGQFHAPCCDGDSAGPVHEGDRHGDLL